jgi:hypothetical protein
MSFDLRRKMSVKGRVPGQKETNNSHLHPTDVPPQTHPSSRAESEEEPLHIAVPSHFLALSLALALSFRLLDPALGSERFDIIAEYP